MYLAAQWMELFEHMVTLVNNVLSDLYQFCKLFDTDFCFQGYEYREKLHAIDFLECSYFRRELQQQATLLSRIQVDSSHSGFLTKTTFIFYQTHQEQEKLKKAKINRSFKLLNHHFNGIILSMVNETMEAETNVTTKSKLQVEFHFYLECKQTLRQINYNNELHPYQENHAVSFHCVVYKIVFRVYQT